MILSHVGLSPSLFGVVVVMIEKGGRGSGMEESQDLHGVGSTDSQEEDTQNLLGST